MKKYIKPIIINIIILLTLFLLLDIFVYYRHLYISHRYHPVRDKISYFPHIFRKMNRQYIDSIMFDDDFYNKPDNIDVNKNSIILFGCSYTAGAGLDENNKLHYLLANKFKIPVYDRSNMGWGTQHMLYQTESDKLYSKIKTPPDIVIYIYIIDHIHRINNAMEPILFGGQPTFVYKKKNNKLVFDNLSLFALRFPLVSYVRDYLFYVFYSKSKGADFLKLHIIQSKNNIQKHYQNDIKFVVLAYEENCEILSLKDELNKNNILLVTYKDLTGYSSRDPNIQISAYDIHPNAKAWELLIPELYKYITDKNIQNKINCEYTNECRKEMKNKSLINSFNYNRESMSDFSLAFKDKQLIKEGKISRIRANIAYSIWCLSNLIECPPLKPISKLLVKLTIKINRYNTMYKQYYDVRYENKPLME